MIEKKKMIKINQIMIMMMGPPLRKRKKMMTLEIFSSIVVRKIKGKKVY